MHATSAGAPLRGAGRGSALGGANADIAALHRAAGEPLVTGVGVAGITRAVGARAGRATIGLRCADARTARSAAGAATDQPGIAG